MHRLRSNSPAKAKISLRVSGAGRMYETAGLEILKVSVVMIGGFMEGGPIVAVICSNLNPSVRMACPPRASTLPPALTPDLPKNPFELGSCRGTTQIRFAGRTAGMFDFQICFSGTASSHPPSLGTFYRLVIGVIVLLGISGIFSASAIWRSARSAASYPLLASIASVVVGIAFSRIAAEFVLIVFRINEHLGAIRTRRMR